MLNLVFLFVFVGQAVADNCASGDSAYKLKSTLTDLYCDTADYTYSDCGQCCEQKPDTCLKLQTAGSTCTAPAGFDNTKTATAATTANFGTTCCKTTCATATGNSCGSKIIDSSKMNTALQADASDYAAQCCKDACTDCCYSLILAATPCPSATPVTKSSAMQSAATASNFGATCCVARKKCDFQCPTGTKQITAYTTTDCQTETCTQNECCIDDPDKCLGVSASCTGNNFRDTAKAGDAATSSTFQNVCCTAKGTCSGFKDYTPPAGVGGTSSTEHLKPIMAPLFAALAVMAV